jgi:hypothetical protein
MRFATLLAWLLLWPSLTVGQANVATIFQETWPVLKTNTGISGPANVDITPHGATPRDSDYPEVGLTDTIKIISNGTRNVLAANTNWLNAGVVWDRIGTVAGVGSKYPNWFDASGALIYYADYHITTASLAANSYAPLLYLMETESFGPVRLNLDLFSTPTYVVELFAQRWNTSNLNVSSTTITKATIENKRIRFQIALTPGTMTVSGTTVLDDGSLVISMIDLDTLVETVLYSYTGQSFYLSYAGELLGGGNSVPADNHLVGVQVGYAGLIGENEQVVIETEGADPTESPDADIETQSSTPCCGDTVAPGGVATGEVGKAVSPDWTAACAGGGSVPTASDLTDAEDWDQ